MNARLWPVSRRCRMCGLPLTSRKDVRDRVCAEHRPLLLNDPFTALEIALSTTGSAPGHRTEPKEVRP